MHPVHVLYTCIGSPYRTLPGVHCWGKDRDARTYDLGLPVVAHPPCARWGRYANCFGRVPGDDGGCGDHAVETVRRCGGILEHPASSGLFARHMMPRPGTGPDLWGGRTVQINQSTYGHRALKPTWLYLVGVPHSISWRAGTGNPTATVEHMGRSERERTPTQLAQALVLAVRSITDANLAYRRTA